MSIIRAQVVLKGGSGLARDQFVNTFHFAQLADAYEAQSAAVATALTAMYQSVDDYFSETVTNSAEIRTYDLGNPEPRVPSIFPLPLTVMTSVFSLPQEVACCLSFRAAAPVTPRRRGRVFLGPLNVNVYAGGLPDNVTPPRPSDNFTDTLRDAGAGLLAADVGWCIHSPTNNTFVPVVGGWVDNEFDTMRSRGYRPTFRQSFGA